MLGISQVPSSITAHEAGYIDRDSEIIVGLQADAPLKRAIMPNGGFRMVLVALETYGYEPDPHIVEAFTKYRRTHNEGVFDAYTPDIRACRSSHILTGLPDAYGRGRIIGDYRRVALYGVDRLVAEKTREKAGLDPTTRELAQTRLVAERAMLIAQRMPQIMQWQAELLAIHTAGIPQVEQLLSDATRLSAAVDHVGTLAKELAGMLRSEEPGLANLSHEVGSTLGEGARMAESTDVALKTLDTILARFDDDEEPSPDKEPFRIKDYAETAAEIGAASERLTTLLGTIEPYLSPETLAKLTVAADTVAANSQAKGQELVDYAFLRGLQMVAAVLCAALVYCAASVWIVRRSV